MKLTKLIPGIVASLAATLLASGILCSCGKDPKPGDPQVAISFRNADTKAVTSDRLESDGSRFSVFGEFSRGGTFSHKSATRIFDNVPVQYSGAESEWTYDDPRYWTAGSVFRFCGYWPAGNAVLDFSDDEVSLTGFSVNTSASNQEDLLLSNINERKTGVLIGAQEKVELNFRHILCNIRFAIVATVSDPGAENRPIMVVTGITLSNVKSKGDFSASIADDCSWANGTWDMSRYNEIKEYSSGELNKELKITGKGHESSIYDNTTIMWKDGFYVIPQSGSSRDVAITVAYTLTKDGKTSNKRVQKTIPFSSDWVINKRITYTLDVDESDNITFGRPTVEPWGKPQASGTIVIN